MFLLCFFILPLLGKEITYRLDTASKYAIDKRIHGSHIKVFMPTMPYLYLSKLINGTLVRSSDNSNGWEYMMATSHKQISPTIYEFYLRENVRFQDGSPFNANSVISNFDYLLQSPFDYSYLFKRLKSVEKTSANTVRFTLKKPYELFLFDLTMINFYPDKYLKKFGWGFKGASTSNSMKQAGPYGLGPYILIEGYATGREQTPIIKLKANPNYYEKPMPYIENITIYTELSTNEVLTQGLTQEGKLDITPIPFNKKIETVLSPYAKLVKHSSTNNISVYLNMLKPQGALKDKKIRIALNEAINQENLLKFVYKDEGVIAPSAASPNYFSVQQAIKNIPTHHEKIKKQNPQYKKYLSSILSGLTLKVFTMERFMFLWKGLEYQLSQYGVKLVFETTTSEKDIYSKLLTNRESPKDWDILTWGNDDWCSNNPWTVFFNYRTDDVWSTIDKDTLMQEYIKVFFESPYNSPRYIDIVKKIITRSYEEAYMLFIPSPNIVLAINKEIDYSPSAVLSMPLWKAKLTPLHWSIRKGDYPKENMMPVKPKSFRSDTKF